jgi:2-amino-4-hydroxy-6-hydroxymethyldihydropteridine diphosphokinase
MARRERVYLSLGSNVGDRETNLCEAIHALSSTDGIRVTRISSWYETDPVGNTEQPAFVNVAAEIETALAPLELLNAVKTVEQRLGRRPSERWGPREIDIDLVLWGSRVMDTERLILPHREFRNRAFVLVPLAEIAKDAVDPVTGLTVGELAERPEAQGRVTKFPDSGHSMPAEGPDRDPEST